MPDTGSSPTAIVSDEQIVDKIHVVRGHKVMLDKDLADMFGVLNKNLNKSVQRNLARFPDDFMFRLTAEEAENLRFHFGTSNRGGRRYLPYAFTEQGVAMLASVLNSDTAIEVNIRIIRIFSRLREMLLTHKDILLKLEHQVVQNSSDITAIFDALKSLITAPAEPRPAIGFKTAATADAPQTA